MAKRNPIARTLRDPKFRQRVIPSVKKYTRKQRNKQKDLEQ